MDTVNLSRRNLLAASGAAAVSLMGGAKKADAKQANPSNRINDEFRLLTDEGKVAKVFDWITKGDPKLSYGFRKKPVELVIVKKGENLEETLQKSMISNGVLGNQRVKELTINDTAAIQSFTIPEREDNDAVTKSFVVADLSKSQSNTELIQSMIDALAAIEVKEHSGIKSGDSTPRLASASAITARLIKRLSEQYADNDKIVRGLRDQTMVTYSQNVSLGIEQLFRKLKNYPRLAQQLIPEQRASARAGY